MGGGQLVAQSRQHLAHRRDQLVHPAGAVDDAAVAADENDVGMLSHEFADDALSHGVAQLVVVFDFHLEDPVAFQRPYAAYPAAGDVLAHQHAQRRRLQWVVLSGRGQVGAGAVGGGRQQQLPVLALVAYGEHDLVPLGLYDFVYATAGQRPVQFPGHEAEGQSVKGHTCSSKLHFLVMSTIINHLDGLRNRNICDKIAGHTSRRPGID